MNKKYKNQLVIPEGLPVMSGESVIGKVTNWDPDTNRVTAALYELKDQDLNFGGKTSFTAKVEQLWVSPHLTNLMEDYRLKYDTWRDENLWTAIGPDGRIGPDYATIEEALAAFPFDTPKVSNEVVQGGITTWKVEDGTDL